MESPNCDNCKWYLGEEDGERWCLANTKPIGDVELCTKWVRDEDD